MADTGVVDLISIPERADQWRLVEHAAESTQSGPTTQSVSFSDGQARLCWAHVRGHDPLTCEVGAMLHFCPELGTGRLGLCRLHDEEILG